MVGLELKCYVKSAYLNISQSTSCTAKLEFWNVDFFYFVLTEKSYLLDNQSIS